MVQCLRVVNVEVFSSLVIGSDGLIPVTLALLEGKKIKVKTKKKELEGKGKGDDERKEG